MTENMTHESADQNDLPEWLRDMTGDEADARPPQVEQKLSPLSVMLILVAVGVLAIIGYAFYERNKETPTEGPAPAFDVTVWDWDEIAMPGERLSLESLKGKTVVLNFWASWCIPCQQEAPTFERVWSDYKDRGVVFIGVNTEDTDSAARDYVREYNLTYPHAPDGGGKAEEAYRITGIPETFVINGEGQIVRHFISSPNERDLRSEIDRALES